MSCHSEYELVLRVAVHIYSIRDYINPNYSEVSLSSEKEHPDLALISIDILPRLREKVITNRQKYVPSMTGERRPILFPCIAPANNSIIAYNT